MQAEVLQCIINLVVWSLALFLIWKANRANSQRHLQFYVPFVLLIVWCYVILNYYSNGRVVNTSFTLFGYTFGFGLTGFLLRPVLLFLVFKNLLRRIAIWFEDAWIARQGSIIAYKKHNQTFLLKRSYYYTYRIIRLASFILGGFFILVLILEPFSFSDGGRFLPTLILIPLSLLLEAYWFLNGEKERLPELPKSNTKPQLYRNIAFYKIWQELRETWPQNFLLSWAFSADNNQNSEGKYKAVYSELRQKNDLILVDAVYDKIADSLFRHVKSITAQQKQVLILLPRELRQGSSAHKYQKEIKGWIGSYLPHLGGKIQIHDPGNSEVLTSDILISSPNDFIHEVFNHSEDFIKWAKSLEFILIFKAQDVFPENLLRLQSIVYYLKTCNSGLQVTFLSDQLYGIQSAIQVNFPIRRRYVEIEGFENLTKNVFFTAWNEENQDYQNAIHRNTGFNKIGTIPALASVAIKNELRSFKFIGSKKAPFQECVEEYDNEYDNLKVEFQKDTAGRNTPLLGSLDLIEFENELLKESDNNAFFIFDEDFNVVSHFVKWRLYAISNVLLNIVSPPYLLREYLVDNLEYFESNPLTAIAPVISGARSSAAFELLVRLTMGFVKEEDLKTYLQIHSPPESNIKYTLVYLLEEVLGIKLEKQWIEEQNDLVFYPKLRDFKNERRIRISRSYFDSIPWFKKVSFVDNSNEHFYDLDADFVYQRYLPQQRHVIYNRFYRIESIDFKRNVCVIKNDENINSVFYRHDYNLTINRENRGFKTIYDSDKYKVFFHEPEIKITTNGYFEFTKEIDLNNPHKASYITLQNVPERKYNYGRLLEFNIFTEQSNYSESQKEIILKTLQALLHEIAPTLYPKTYYYAIIFSTVSFHEQALKKYFPKVKLDNGFNKNSLYILEDTHQDVGLIGSLIEKENLDLFLELCQSYLSWLQNNRTKRDIGEILGVDYDLLKSKSLHRNFMKYGFLEYPKDIDPTLTLQFLRNRLGENQQVKPKNTRYHNRYTQDNECDFCGKKLVVENFTVFDDGRERCNECDKVGIDTMEQLTPLYEKIKQEYSIEFRKLTLPSHIKLELVDAQFIHEVLGLDFIPTSSFDKRSVGLASRNGNEYFIYIEKGFSPELTQLTIVHELTHIFQYSNLNFSKMKKIGGDLLVEGHARWSEIDYLRFKKKTAEANELLSKTLAQNDKYGNGFKFLMNEYADKNVNSNNNLHEVMVKYFPKS